jgi:V/A-type H+-transporting ATPase subunit E
MKGLETGSDKVKKICKVLKEETLEPAQREAGDLIEMARRKAEEILLQAREQAEKLLAQTKSEIEKQKAVFQASLFQACRQTLESLKEKIERKLVSPELGRLVAQSMQNPKDLAGLITAAVEALHKEGLEANLSVYISSAVPIKDVNQLLSVGILERLREKSVLLSSIGGGIEVKLVKENITIDLSDSALKEIVSEYIRKDFREFIFGS